MIRPAFGIEQAHVEGGDGDGGRQQEIVLLEERAHGIPVRELPAAHGDVLGAAIAQAVLDRGDEPRVHPVPELGQVFAVFPASCTFHSSG